MVYENIIATSASADTGCGKVQGVAVNLYNHVAGGVSNGGTRVGIGVVEEPQGCLVGLFGGLRLLGREGTKGDENGRINGDGIIEECADYLLHKVDGLRGETRWSAQRHWRIVFWRRRWGLSRHRGHSVVMEDWGVGTCADHP